MNSLPNFITDGAPLRALRARGGSAKNDLKTRVSPPTVKPVYNKSAYWKLRNFDWIKLRGSRAIHGSYATGFQTSLFWTGKLATFTDFVAKCKGTPTFGNDYFTTCNNLICCKRGLIPVGGNQLLSATKFTTMV